MNNKIHLRAVYSLVLLAMSILLAYFSGALDRQIDLLKSEKVPNIDYVNDGKNTASIKKSTDHIGVSCVVVEEKSDTFCGATFWTSTVLKEGWDITNFDRLEIGISVANEFDNRQVKLTFKNYNEKYSKSEDVVSQKFNSVTATLDKNKHIYSFPLEFFRVESWWINQYNVHYNDAQTDLSNVQSLDVIYNNLDKIGNYELIVYQAKLHGKWLSLTHVMSIVILIMFISIVILINRQIENQRQLSFMDPLTGLANRRGMQAWVDELNCSQSALKKASLLYMDIDDFKHINDKYGHLIGDILLKTFCKLVQVAINDSTIGDKNLKFTRLSGDEFAIMLVNQDPIITKQLAESIFKQLTAPVHLDGHSINISVSMGVSNDILHSADLKILFGKADAAMYYAKRRGKNSFKEYDANVESEQMSHKRIADELIQQIESDALKLKFLPIYNTLNKHVESVEVVFTSDSELLKHQDTQTLYKIAQEHKLLDAVDAWTINATLSMLKNNYDAIAQLGVKFCVNVTTLEVANSSFVENLAKQLNYYRIPATWIGIEVSESAASKDYENSCKDLKILRDMEITLTLDEFGVSATSLNHLVHYPVDTLKIHQSFIQNLSSNNEQSSIVVESVISLAKTCKLKIIAEGVNNLDQFYCLEKLGCDMIQGLIFCDPLSIEELLKALKSQTMFSTYASKSIAQ
ncbi:EAL domain-containing protein [Glaciecola sp. SC05]|uniref:EAL domain-containing protein n=1 Tax=Glaciecola sp. SC05 TaxID=1987355 RepID=UPI0035270BB3